MDFTFFSDSICSLWLLRENLLTTNKLAANSMIQKENLELLSTQFDEGVVRAAWLPSKLNLSDILKRAVVNPVKVVNSSWYRHGVALSGDKFVDLVGKLKDGNTFLEVRGGESVYHHKDVNLLEDCGYFDKLAKECWS